jgi:carboxypeptidase Q
VKLSDLLLVLIVCPIQLGLRPRRTLRLILWTCEEFGGIGGEAYFAAHQQNITQNYVLAIESDLGAFSPTGFGITGSPSAFAIVSEVAQLVAPLNASQVVKGGGGEDIGPMGRVGVPTMSPTTMDSTYFWFHHTNADTMTAILPQNMDMLAASVGVMAYTVADLKERLPKN